MTKTWEVWRDPQDESVQLATVEGIADLRLNGGLSPAATLLHRFEADILEEAMAVYHIKMGWEPYEPPGAPADCPFGCGCVYYPEGSAECPKCGPIP